MAEQSPENNSSSENSGKVLGKIVGVQGRCTLTLQTVKRLQGRHS